MACILNQTEVCENARNNDRDADKYDYHVFFNMVSEQRNIENHSAR